MNAGYLSCLLFFLHAPLHTSLIVLLFNIISGRVWLCTAIMSGARTLQKKGWRDITIKMSLWLIFNFKDNTFLFNIFYLYSIMHKNLLWRRMHSIINSSSNIINYKSKKKSNKSVWRRKKLQKKSFCRIVIFFFLKFMHISQNYFVLTNSDINCNKVGSPGSWKM